MEWHEYTDANGQNTPVINASITEKASIIGRVGIMFLSCGTGAWRVRSSMNALAEAMGITCLRQWPHLIGALTAGLLASLLKNKVGYPRISVTVPSIVIMVPGLYLYRGFYNLGIMSLSLSASWFAAALLIIAALPLGLIFARILTDKAFRYCT